MDVWSYEDASVTNVKFRKTSPSKTAGSQAYLESKCDERISRQNLPLFFTEAAPRLNRLLHDGLVLTSAILGPASAPRREKVLSDGAPN